MKKTIVTLLAFIVLTGSLSATEFKVGGVYTAWAQNQQSFKLDADNYNMNYVIQMLRFKVQGVANDNLKFVTRFDIAQGWWGVDNMLRGVERWGKTGASSLFDFKDTNYLMHVDQAYVDFKHPTLPFSMKIGRQWFGLGHKIILDNNFDGIQIGLLNGALNLGWAKVSEGGDNTTDEGPGNGDSDLYLGNYKGSLGSLKYNAFGLYYKENVTEDDLTAYILDDLQFFRNRDAATVTQLTAFGASVNYKAGKLTVDGEFDFLTGKDDINDLDLSGYNLYAKATFAANGALKLGGVFGLGSGDDPTDPGFTNVNKLRTSGFFYITEIWEDSIMPDEEGITPQGLGAPNVRAYRELENTTIIQGNADYKLTNNLALFVSGSYIMATNEIKEADADGNYFAGETGSTALGTEVDFRLKYSVYKNMFFMLRGGYFIPGDAAGYLINGHADDMDPAYELKGMIVYKF